MMVVVDSTGKHGHFIPTHTTVTALGSAQLYLQQVWKLHGLSLSVLSDHGLQFADGACQPGTGAVLAHLCELETGWLGWLAANGQVHIQQSYSLIHTAHPILCQHWATSSHGVEAVTEFTNCMKGTLSKAHAALAKSKDNMTHYYN